MTRIRQDDTHDIPLIRVNAKTVWPRTLDVPVQASDGTWRVRLRCSDGVIRRFKSRRADGMTSVALARKEMSPAKRYAILSRDGFRCRYCGRTPPEVKLHVDHVIAVSKGGTSDDDNLVAACEDCNLGKSVA